MKKQYVKPADGLKVRNPRGGHLPAEGADVTINPYWTRRLRDGDVLKATKPKTLKTKLTTAHSGRGPSDP